MPLKKKAEVDKPGVAEPEEVFLSPEQTPEPENISPEPIKPEVKPVQSMGSRETPSLFRKKKVAESHVTNSSTPLNEEPIQEEELIKAWGEFGEMRKATGVGEMEQLILSRSIKLMGETDVTIILNSQLELSIVERIEHDLVYFLREQLKNDTLQLQKEVREEEKTKKLYTSSDKYEYMLQQNPKLKDLKDRLGLDFEF